MPETNRELGAVLDLYVVGNTSGEVGAQDGRDGLVSLLKKAWQHAVLDRNAGPAPPGSPTVGDRYLPQLGATGDWAGHDFEIAEWLGAGGWHFWPTTKGMVVFVDNEDTWFYWNGTGWAQFASFDEVNALRGAVSALGPTGANRFVVDDDNRLRAEKQVTSATGDTSTPSATDVLVAGMTLTAGPAKKDCFLRFTGSVDHSATGNDIELSIFVNAVKVAESERRFVRGNQNITMPFCCEALVTLETGDVVEGRWRTSAATATMHERTLVIDGVID